MRYRCSIARLSSKQPAVNSLGLLWIIVRGPGEVVSNRGGVRSFLLQPSLTFFFLLTLTAAADTFAAPLCCSAALELLRAAVKPAEREMLTSAEDCQNKTLPPLMFGDLLKVSTFFFF